MSKIIYESELYHHGILGQKWGIRRYQNKNGSLTAAGKKRYGTKLNLEIDQDYIQARKTGKLPRKAIKGFNSAEVQDAYQAMVKSRKPIMDFNNLNTGEWVRLAEGLDGYKTIFKRGRPITKYNILQKINVESLFDRYLQEKHIDPEEFNDYTQSLALNYTYACRKAAKDFVKNNNDVILYSQEKINGFKYSSPITPEDVMKAMIDEVGSRKIDQMLGYSDSHKRVTSRQQNTISEFYR